MFLSLNYDQGTLCGGVLIFCTLQAEEAELQFGPCAESVKNAPVPKKDVKAYKVCEDNPMWSEALRHVNRQLSSSKSQDPSSVSSSPYVQKVCVCTDKKIIGVALHNNNLVDLEVSQKEIDILEDHTAWCSDEVIMPLCQPPILLHLGYTYFFECASPADWKKISYEHVRRAIITSFIAADLLSCHTDYQYFSCYATDAQLRSAFRVQGRQAAQVSTVYDSFFLV